MKETALALLLCVWREPRCNLDCSGVMRWSGEIHTYNNTHDHHLTLHSPITGFEPNISTAIQLCLLVYLSELPLCIVN